MPIGVDSGYKNYSGPVSSYLTSNPTSYIAPVFSAKTLKKFYAATVLNEITSTEYLGEIKDVGDTVIITTDPDVQIKNYQKGMDLELDYYESPAFALTIKYAKYFNFGIDDVDNKQMFIKRMDAWAENAAKRMKITIEQELFSLYAADSLTLTPDPANVGTNAGKKSGNINLGTSTAPVGVNRNNVLDYFVFINQVLDEQDVPDDGSRYIVIPAWMASMLKLSDLKDASITGLGESILLNGRLGKIDNITIYKSNLLPTGTATVGGNEVTYTVIPFGHKNGLAFVTQLTKVETYRPEKKFMNAIKGLQVYGFEIVYPQLVGKLIAYKNE